MFLPLCESQLMCHHGGPTTTALSLSVAFARILGHTALYALSMARLSVDVHASFQQTCIECG